MTEPTNKRNETVANIADILGTTPLLINEDKERYLKLKTVLQEEVQPKTFFEKLHLQDLLDKIWEEHRFKRNQAALLESGSVQSLAALLAPADGENHEGALRDAQDYYSGNPKKRRPVEKLLAKMGITPQHIEANALHMRSISLQTLDRMISSRETARNSIIKNIERRQIKAAKKLRKKQASNDDSIGGDAPDQSERPRPFDGVHDEQ